MVTPGLWNQQVRAAAIRAPHELDGRVPVGERALERVARGEAPGERETGVARLQLLEGAWHLEKQMRRSVRSAHGSGTIAVEGSELVMAWLRAVNEEVVEGLRVPRSLYDEIAADPTGWQALREELSAGPFVDMNRLLFAAA